MKIISKISKIKKILIADQEEYPKKYAFRNIEDYPNAQTISFPQADTDFSPPLFYPLEKWSAGSQWGLMDMKLAFMTLYKTLNSLGYFVNETPREDAQMIIRWSAKHVKPNEKGSCLTFEHGWIPRWSYQVTPLGSNAQSHIADYTHVPLNNADRIYIVNYLNKMRAIFEDKIDNQKVRNIQHKIKKPYILVPFQLATDFNLKFSESNFSHLYSRDKENNIVFCQALVDYIEKFDLPYAVIFKQHPVDPINGLADKLVIKNKNNILLTKEECNATN